MGVALVMMLLVKQNVNATVTSAEITVRHWMPSTLIGLIMVLALKLVV